MVSAAKVFYELVFMEKFIQAAGEESFDRDLVTAINPTIERLVREAGTQAGLAYREHVICTGGVLNGVH